MKNYLYLKTIWSSVAAFSDMFNDLSVLVYNNQGQAIGWKPVPITIGPKEKVVSALIAQDTDNPDSVFSPDNYLPRLSVTWNGISRSPERQRGQKMKRRLFIEYLQSDKGREYCLNRLKENGGIINPDNLEALHSGYSPQPIARVDTQTVPYVLNLELSIWTKYMDDMAQILENILPFFNPEAYVSFVERGIGTERKAKVTLDSINPNFVTELDNTSRRVLQMQLAFSMEMNFYRPEEPIEKPIRRVTIRLGEDETRSDIGLGFPEARGETVNVVSLPCLSGSCDYLDMDKRLWSIIKPFTRNEELHMADYHNRLCPDDKVEPNPESYINPNNNGEEDAYWGLYGEQMDYALGNYTFTIENPQYEKEAFFVDGQTVSLGWVPVVIESSVDDYGNSGTLYKGGLAYTTELSGVYYIDTPSDTCDAVEEERRCDD
jgi:hypothetical protein